METARAVPPTTTGNMAKLPVARAIRAAAARSLEHFTRAHEGMESANVGDATRVLPQDVDSTCLALKNRNAQMLEKVLKIQHFAREFDTERNVVADRLKTWQSQPVQSMLCEDESVTVDGMTLKEWMASIAEMDS